jgi:CRISPR/Cas system-associated endoribonuclease Cas2
MATYTITLSDAEDKALGVVAFSQDDWIQNAVHERCRIAMEEIIAAEVQRLLGEGKSITGSKDDIVIAAPIKSAAERQAEAQAQQPQV